MTNKQQERVYPTLPQVYGADKECIMKRVIALLLAVMMMVGVTACTATTEYDSGEEAGVESSAD